MENRRAEAEQAAAVASRGRRHGGDQEDREEAARWLAAAGKKAGRDDMLWMLREDVDIPRSQVLLQERRRMNDEADRAEEALLEAAGRAVRELAQQEWDDEAARRHLPTAPSAAVGYPAPAECEDLVRWDAAVAAFHEHEEDMRRPTAPPAEPWDAAFDEWARGDVLTPAAREQRDRLSDLWSSLAADKKPSSWKERLKSCW